MARVLAESIVTHLYSVHDRMQDDGLHTFVQRSDFVTRLAAPLVVGSWSEAYGQSPKPREPLSERERERLAAIIDTRFEKLLRDANSHCGEVIWELARLLSARRSHARLGDYSERVSVWVRQRLASGEPPEPSDCWALAERLIEDTPTELPASAKEFREAYADRYDELWLECGAANLASYLPADVGLGPNHRPPLLRTAVANRRDWTQGVNRPVYERYRLWFKGSASVAAPRCTSEGCQQRATISVVDVGATEVARACEVYGLAHPEHQQVVRSLAEGIGQAWLDRGWTTWERWAQPCRPISLDGELDPDLEDAMASAVSAWTSSAVGRPLINEYGAESLRTPLLCIVVRKAWMDLLGYERTFADPVRRCGIPKTVRTALYRLVQKALPEWMAGHIGGGDEELPPDPALSTMALLTDHPDIARLMLAEAPGWRARYESLVEPFDAQEYLTAEQALELLRRLIEGMDT